MNRRTNENALADWAAKDTDLSTDNNRNATTDSIKSANKSAKPKRGRSAVEALTSLDRERQKSRQSASKQQRIVGMGVTSRVRGHVLGQGRRSQARRDSKSG